MVQLRIRTQGDPPCLGRIHHHNVLRVLIVLLKVKQKCKQLPKIFKSTRICIKKPANS